MNTERLLRTSHHEMSHLLVYLFLGGSIDDIKDMQIKLTVGYFDQRSFPIGNNYFARACVALAGPVSEKMMGIDYAGCDIANAKQFIKGAVYSSGVAEADHQKWMDFEYSAAWKFTQDILETQKDMLEELKIKGVKMINGSNLITRNKLKKIAHEVIRHWDESEVEYYKHPTLIVRK